MRTLKRDRSRARPWTAAALGTALAAAWLALLAPTAGADLSTNSHWPMFRHEAQHTGQAAVSGPNTAALRWRQATGGSVYSSPSVFNDPGARKVWYLHGESWPARATAIASTPADARPGLPAADPSPVPNFQALRSVAPDASLRALSTPIAANTQVRLGVFETSAANAGQNNWDPGRETIPAGAWGFKFWARSRLQADPTVRGQVWIFFKVFKFQQPLVGSPDDPDDPLLRDALLLFDTVDEYVVTNTDLAQFTVEKDVDAITLDDRTLGSETYWGVRVEVWASNPTVNDATVRFEYEGDHGSRVETPAIDPCVYVASDDGSLYAMNASTGDLHWSYAYRRASQLLFLRYDPWTEFAGLSPGAGDTHMLASATPDAAQWVTFSWDTGALGALPTAITQESEKRGWATDMWPAGSGLVGGKWRMQITYRNTSSSSDGTLWYRMLTANFDGNDLVLSRTLRGWTQGPALPVAAANTSVTTRFDTDAVPSTTLDGTEGLYIELACIPDVLTDVWELQTDTVSDTLRLPPLDRMRSSPAIDDEGIAYIGAELGPDYTQGRLYAVNADGELEWLFPSDPETVWFHPVDGSDWGALDYTDASAQPQMAQAQTGAGANVYVQWRANSAPPNPPNVVVEASPSQDLTRYGWLTSPAEVGLAGRTLVSGSWRLLLQYYVTSTATLPTGYVHYRITKVSLSGAPASPTRVEELLGWTQYSHPLTGLIRPGVVGQVYTLDINTPTVAETTFDAGEYVYVELYVQQVDPGDAGAIWVLSDTGGPSPTPPQLDTAGFERLAPAERLYLRALGQPTAATVATTAHLTRTQGTTEDTATSVLTVAASTDYYQWAPSVTDNSVFLAALPAGITQYGWIAEEPDWEGQELAAGSYRLRVRYSVSDASDTPEATLWYRISQVTTDSTPAVVQLRTLLDWTASPTLAPTLTSPLYQGLTFDTPEVASAALGQGEFLYLEYFVQPTVATGVARRWTLHVELDASWLRTNDVLTSPVAGISSSPAVAADDASTIVFGDLGGHVYGLDRSGAERWDPAAELPTLAEVEASPAIAPAGSPHEGTVYVGDLDGYMYALDGDSGAILWRYPAAGPFGAIRSSAVVDGSGNIYYATDRSFDGLSNGRVVSLDADGALRWTFTPTNPRAAPAVDDIRGSPALSFDGEMLYVGSDDGNLYAIEADDGSPEWFYLAGTWDPNVPATTRYRIRSSPAVAPGLKLYLHDDPAGVDTTQLLASAPPTRNRRTKTTTVGAGLTDVPVHAFETAATALSGGVDSGDPDVATIPAGVWSFVITARAEPNPLLPAETADLKFRVSWVDGTTLIPTVLFTSGAQTLTDTFARYTVTGLNPTAVQLDLNNLDYLRVEALADTPGNTQSVDVHLRYDGTTGSRVEQPELIYFGCDDGRIYAVADVGSGALDVFVNDDDGNGVLNDPADTGGWDPNWNPALGGPNAPFRSSPSLGVAPFFRSASGQTTRDVNVLYIGSLDWMVYAVGLGPQGVLSTGGMGYTGFYGGSAIRISKRASPTVVCGGSAVNPPDKQVTYTMRVENDGVANARLGLTGAASNIVVTEELPYGVTVVAGSITSPGVQAGNTVVWDFTPLVLLPGETITMSYTAEVIAGFDGTDPDPQPVVAVGTEMPDPDDDQPSDGPKPFLWGDYLYLWLKGRGQPAYLSDRAEVAWTETDTGVPGRRQSREVVVQVGWGKRYKVTLTYSPATDPNPGVVPENQNLTVEMDITRTAVTRHTGSQLEIYESGEPGRITIAKFRIQPYATGQDVSQPPNRPWTPYYWKAYLQQAVCEAQGPWSLPVWERYDGTDPSVYDVLVQNPLGVDPAVLQLRSAAAHNPGTNTGWDSFSVENRSRYSLGGGGGQVRWRLGTARNVVRWHTVDLGQDNAASPGLALALPNYEPRLENYWPEHTMTFSPSDSLSLGAGQTWPVLLWGEVPRHLSPGTYAAPSAVSSAAPMRIYADLNGNMAWDPGEARYEDEEGGTYEEFTFSIGVATDPLLQPGYETGEVGKAAHGTAAGWASYPGGAIENLGNLAMPAVTVDPLDLSGYLPLERADLQLSLRRPGETTPLWWDLSAFSTSIAKAPVRAVTPTVGWLNLSPALSEGLPAGTGPGLPSGTYVGLPDFTTTVTDPIAGGSLTALAPGRLAVRATEERLTTALGADIMPTAAFTGNDTLALFWSSNRLSGGGSPTPADPYYLYAQTLTRDRAVTPWNAAWSGAGGPYPGVDPMSTPAGVTNRGHMAPGFGLDGSGSQWLYWGAWGLRPGPKYDARLLWVDWNSGSPDWNQVDSLPPVYPFGTLHADAESIMSGAFKVHPSPLGWTYTQVSTDQLERNEYDLKAVWAEGNGRAWQLMLHALHRLSTRANVGDPWTPDAAGWVSEVTPLEVSRDLSDVRDPVAFADPAATGLVDVVFTARSGQEGNHDIYHARYAPAYLDNPLTYGQVPFGVLTDRLTPRSSANATFAARHRRWAQSLYGVGAAYVANGSTTVTGVGTLWSAGLVAGDRIRFGADVTSYAIASVDSDTQVTLASPYGGVTIAAPGVGYAVGPVRIYVCPPDQDPSPGAEIGGMPSAYDASAGRYVLTGTRYGTVEVYPDLGLLNFRDLQPNNGEVVYVSYAPRLMRLTTSPRDDVTPAAFVETYRYLDGGGTPQPAGFTPRLWVFHTRSGGEGSAPRVYLQTFRQANDASGNLGWLPETRNHSDYWSTDVSETIIPLEHAANEFGLAAVKDPVLAQVWLFWSSTRGLSAGPGVPVTHNSDIYYMTLNPSLP